MSKPRNKRKSNSKILSRMKLRKERKRSIPKRQRRRTAHKRQSRQGKIQRGGASALERATMIEMFGDTVFPPWHRFDNPHCRLNKLPEAAAAAAAAGATVGAAEPSEAAAPSEAAEPQQQAEALPLPQGWAEMEDKKGNTYYVNSHTGKKQRQLPTEPAQRPAVDARVQQARDLFGPVDEDWLKGRRDDETLEPEERALAKAELERRGTLEKAIEVVEGRDPEFELAADDDDEVSKRELAGLRKEQKVAYVLRHGDISSVAQPLAGKRTRAGDKTVIPYSSTLAKSLPSRKRSDIRAAHRTGRLPARRGYKEGEGAGSAAAAAGSPQ